MSAAWKPFAEVISDEILSLARGVAKLALQMAKLSDKASFALH
jgi:hypothetical protein